MSVRVTLQDGTTIEGTPEEAAATVRALKPAAPTHKPTPPGPTPSGTADDLEPPSPEEIADYIMGLPGQRHTMTNITMHFAHQTIESRVGDQQNPLYRRWIEASNRARSLVETRAGGKFEVEQQGRKRTYFLVKSP